jgi:hypothetical protein
MAQPGRPPTAAARPRNDGQQVFNLLAIVEFVVALGVGLLVAVMAVYRTYPDPGWKHAVAYSFLCCTFAVAMILDLFFRYVGDRRQRFTERLFDENRGGLLLLLPMWLLMLVAVGVALAFAYSEPAPPPLPGAVPVQGATPPAAPAPLPTPKIEGQPVDKAPATPATEPSP